MKFETYFLFSCAIPFVSVFPWFDSVVAVSWHNCGKPTDPIQVLSLSAFSNQTEIVYLSGEVKLETNISSPLKATVDMKKKFFWGWTDLPCVDQIGSCNYEDVCELIPTTNEPCPVENTSSQTPCACPFQEGRYTLKNYPINLSVFPQWMEKGKYRIKLKLLQNAEQLICLLVDVKV